MWKITQSSGTSFKVESKRGAKYGKGASLELSRLNSVSAANPGILRDLKYEQLRVEALGFPVLSFEVCVEGFCVSCQLPGE